MEKNTTIADTQRNVLSCAVPGDLLVIPGDHVVIIQNLNYEEGKQYIDNYADVAVIHSTQGLKGEKATWCVQKGTWESIQKTVTGYRLRRYKNK